MADCTTTDKTLSSGEVTLFDATEDDYQWAKGELVRGYATNFGMTEGSKGYKSLISDANATFKKDSSERRTWVASIDGDTAGIVTATIRKSSSVMASWALIKSHGFRIPQRGVATKLIKKCESWAKENGISDVHIETYKELVGTSELYNACGYTLQEDKSKSVKAYERQLTEELWIKKLES